MLPSLIILTAVINIAAIFWLGPGRDPDTHVGLTEMLATCWVFAVWTAGMIGWGAALRRRLLPSSPLFVFDLALGSAFIAALGLIFGLLGLIGPEARWIFTLFNYVGIFIGLRPKLRWPFAGRTESGLTAFFILIVTLRGLKSFFAWSHTDPLFYQLYGPRLWIDHGSIYFPTQAPIIFQTGFWEYLHIWGLRLLSSEPGRGLIEGQIFGQLTHCIIGYGGSALALFALCRRILKLAVVPSLLCVLAGLSVRDLQWVAILAKNDWGGVLWITTGIILLFERGGEKSGPTDRAQPYLAGLFLGLGVAVKFTNAFLIGSVLLTVFLFSWRRTSFKLAFKHYCPIFFCVVLAILPHWIRNYWYTHNPLFPYFDHWFHSPKMSPGLYATADFYNDLDTRRDWNFWIERLEMVRQDWQYFVLLLLMPLAIMIKRVRHTNVQHLVFLFAGTLLGAMIFLSCRGRYEARHLGTILVFLAVLGPAAFFTVLEKMEIKAPLKSVGAPALLALILVHSDLFIEGRYHDWPLTQVFQRLASSPSLDNQIRTVHPGGRAMAWLRTHIDPTEKVMTTGDRQLYYLSGLDTSSTLDDPKVASRLVGQTDPEQIFSVLRSAGVRYLLEIKFLGKVSPSFVILRPWLERHPSQLVFSSDDALIIDLSVNLAAL